MKPSEVSIEYKALNQKPHWLLYKRQTLLDGFSVYRIADCFADFRTAYDAAMNHMNEKNIAIEDAPIRVIFKDRTVYTIETDGDLMYVMLKAI
jgi:hypothetical protein